MTRDIKAGRASVTLRTKDTEFQRGLKRASRQLRTFSSQIAGVGKALAGVGVAMVTPLVLSVKHFAKIGDAAHKAALRTGLTTEALSELGFAAEQSGANAETLEKGIKTMQRSIVDLGRGLSTQKDAFGALGLTFEDLRKLSPEDQLSLLADRLSGIADPTQRAALAMQLLGRSGQQLVPLLSLGSEGMARLREQGRLLGKTISGSASDSAADLTDAMNELKTSVVSVAFTVGSVFAPSVAGASRNMSSAAGGVRDFITENNRMVRGVGKLAGLLGALAAGFLSIAGVTAITGTALAAVGAGGAAAATAIGAVAVALAGIPLIFAGVIAIFNDGVVAGVNLGDAWLRLADDLGVLRKVMRKTSDGLRLEEDAEALQNAAGKVTEATSRLNNATGAVGRLNAEREVLRALKAQLAARERLNKTLSDAGQSAFVGLVSVDKITAEIEERQASVNEAITATLGGEVEVGVSANMAVGLGRVETGEAVKTFRERMLAMRESLVEAAREQLRESKAKIDDFNFSLELFGADEEKAIRLNLQREAEELKKRAEELNQLTPEVEARIDATSIRLIDEQLAGLSREIELDLSIQSSAQGIFDVRAAQSLAGNRDNAPKRTATATERTAKAVEDIARNATPLRFS